MTKKKDPNMQPIPTPPPLPTTINAEKAKPKLKYTRTATDEERDQLFQAIDNHDLVFIRNFFENNKDVDINGVIKDNTSLLSRSLNFRNVDYIEIPQVLLKLGMNSNESNPRGLTLLMSAPIKKRNIVDLLISYNAKIDAKDKLGNTPLTHAIKDSHTDKAFHLIDKGASVTSKNLENETVMHILALKESNKDIQKLFTKIIEAGGDINATKIGGKTPLHLAAEQGNLKMLELLIQNNANLNIEDIEGNLPLQLAAKYGQVEIVEKLFNEKFLDKKNKSGQSLAHLATISGNIKLVDCLYNKKIDFNLMDKNGSLPIHLATENGHTEIVEKLVGLGCDVNSRDNNGNTPLHLAAEQSNAKMVNVLLKLGAKTEKQNHLKETALQFFTNKEQHNIQNKVNNLEIQNLFQELNLILRTANIEQEIVSLNKYRKEGNYLNVQRIGQRGKSATLLVPDVNITPYDLHPTGLLHNADESLIRAYMYSDSYTDNNSGEHGARRNDRHFFVPVLSKKDFSEKYTNFTQQNEKYNSYNEIIANVSHKSILGITFGNSNQKDKEKQENENNRNKIKALEDKFYLSEIYRYDLPMVMVADGKITIWNPDLQEIKELAKKDYNIGTNWKPYIIKPNLIKLGFALDKEGELIILNKNEVGAKEVRNFLQDMGLPKIAPYMDKLLTVVNTRLKNDDLPVIDKLDDFIIHKEDIKNFVKIIDQEISLNHNDNIPKNNKNLEILAEDILISMQSTRPKKLDFPELNDYKSVRELLKSGLDPSMAAAMEVKKDLDATQNAKQFFTKTIQPKKSEISSLNVLTASSGREGFRR